MSRFVRSSRARKVDMFSRSLRFKRSLSFYLRGVFYNRILFYSRIHDQQQHLTQGRTLSCPDTNAASQVPGAKLPANEFGWGHLKTFRLRGEIRRGLGQCPAWIQEVRSFRCCGMHGCRNIQKERGSSRESSWFVITYCCCCRCFCLAPRAKLSLLLSTHERLYNSSRFRGFCR